MEVQKKVDQLTDSIKGQVSKAGLQQTEVGQFASIHKAVEYSQLCRKVHFARHTASPGQYDHISH